VSKKDADQLVRDLRRYFRRAGSSYRLEVRGGHWHVVDGHGHSVYPFAGTPSDRRFRQNTVSDLRRLGVVPREWR
jgi:hypothetical protein